MIQTNIYPTYNFFLKQSVTVIIPVFNAENSLVEMIESLLGQTYFSERAEYIFVDNGSTDNSVEIIKNYPVTLMFSSESKNPYIARNKALEKADGDIIAFTDANKIPSKKWLEAGVEEMNKSKADMIGGNILFKIDEKSTTSEIYDSITFNNNRNLVELENASATGNLFVRRELFEKLGTFPKYRRSGMDIWWTQNAVKNGYKLKFSEQSIVYCIPRNFKNVMQKSYRVGISHPYNLLSDGISKASIILTSIKTFSPPKISKIKHSLSEKGVKNYSLFNLW